LKKILSVLMMLLLLTAFAANAFALEGATSNSLQNLSNASADKRFTYIIKATTGLEISGGVANCLASLTCDPNTTRSCSATIFLQRRAEGTTTWYTVATKSSGGTYFVTVSDSRTTSSGYEYRVKAKYTVVGTDGGTETVYGYSKIAP